MLSEQIAGHSVKVDALPEVEGRLALQVAAEGFGNRDLVLHWGVGRQSPGEWAVPGESQVQTTPPAVRVQGAFQTSFPEPDSNGCRKVVVQIDTSAGLKGFQFVLHRKPNDWLKCGSRNFVVDLDRLARTKYFREAVQKATDASPSAKVSCWSCNGSNIAVLATPDGVTCKVKALVDSERDLVLQYGPAGRDRRWTSSTRLQLAKLNGGTVSEGSIVLAGADINAYLMFVLHDASTNQWLKDGGRDFAFEMPACAPGPEQAAAEAPVASAQPAVEAKAPEPPAGGRFEDYVKEAKQEDPNAVARAWPACQGVEFAISASASEQECGVQVVVASDATLVLQYGSAGADRAWKFSKRLPLVKGAEGLQEACFALPAASADRYLMFVLHDGAVNRWIKDGNRDFELELPRHPEWDRLQREAEAEREAEAAKAKAIRQAFLADRRAREVQADVAFASFELERDCGDVDVGCRSLEGGKKVEVEVRAWLHPRLGTCTMHFGYLASGRASEWSCPADKPSVQWPSGMTVVDKKACQVQLSPLGDQVQGLDFSMPATVSHKDGEDVVEPEIAGISFVMKNESGNEWFKPKDGGNATVRFTFQGRWKGEWAAVVDKIVEQEVTWSQMSLKRRYENCLEFVAVWERQVDGMQMRRLPSWNTLVHVDSSRAVWSRMPSMPLCDIPEEEDIKKSKEEFWSWMFVWHRFSFQRFLTWERNTCTQPRMLAGTTNAITIKMAELWKAHPRCRMWIRWTLATMGRGGSAGQQIRDQILVIMHAHDIKEIHGTYYEQWHQKLHNNTTPEDIGICRAIIAYLRSNGDMGEYWKVIHDHGMSKERLASYSRPITTEPYMVKTDIGRLIKDFEDYLGILRSVHDALDLQLALDHARGCLSGHLQGKLQEVCNMGGTGFGSLDEGHGKLMRIAAAREDMLAMLNKSDTPPHVIKELLIIDFTLETQQSVLIQGMTSENRLPQLSDQLKVMLMSLVGHMPMEDELQAILADWTKLAPDCAAQRWNGATESALLLKAMSDRLSRIVGELSDRCQTMMGPKAAFLGAQVDVPQRNIDVFVDEVLRGTSLIAVSLALQRVEPVLRSLAHLPPWQLISTVDKPVHGEFKLIDKMMHIQDKVFTTPTILLSGAVSGEEEVPDGVLAVLVRSAKEAPDILSHCAVRARNSKVLLATCFDPAISAKLAQDFEGKWVEVRCTTDGHLTVEASEPPLPGVTDAASAAATEADMKAAADRKVEMNLTNDLGCAWCIRPEEMTREKVGSKSLNLALLQPRLPSGVLTPQAVALPYGCMQKALTDPANASSLLPRLQQVLGKLQPSTSNEDAQVVFEEAQELVLQMKMPEDLKAKLAEAMAQEGAKQGEERLKELLDPRDAWAAIKGVWASLFALRPWVSLAKAGRSFHDLNMAVLVQELVEAKYAFVLHTVNPFTHDKDELYGELFAGRGEAIVGNYPGRALSFKVKRGGEVSVVAFPSKSVALHTQHCLIFRSDSNGEDLEGFAGAGLFESICAQSDAVGFVRLHRLPVVTDRAYRQDLLKRIAEVGWATETAFGGAPQDIEGCVDTSDRIFIVQSRPQV